MALVSGLPTTLYQVGNLTEGASFNNLLDAVDGTYCTTGGGDDPIQDGIYPHSENCGTAPRSNVFSTSCKSSPTSRVRHIAEVLSDGVDEADLTPAYANRQCQEYAKMGIMGVTFLFSSGDFGVAGNGAQCIASSGKFYFFVYIHSLKAADAPWFFSQERENRRSSVQTARLLIPSFPQAVPM